MQRLVIAVVGVFLLGVGGRVNADVIAVTFSGLIDTVVDPTNGRFTDGILPGMGFKATVTYDSNVPPSANSTTHVAEYPYLSSSLTIGTKVFTTHPPYQVGLNNVTIIYHTEQTDAILLYGFLNGSSQYSDGSYYLVGLGDGTQSAFSSNRLPTSLNFEQFQGGSLGLALKPLLEDQTPFASVYGTVTGVSATTVPTAPEPSTLALLGSAGAGLFGVAWRRRRWGRRAARWST